MNDDDDDEYWERKVAIPKIVKIKTDIYDYIMNKRSKTNQCKRHLFLDEYSKFFRIFNKFVRKKKGLYQDKEHIEFTNFLILYICGTKILNQEQKDNIYEIIYRNR